MKRFLFSLLLLGAVGNISAQILLEEDFASFAPDGYSTAFDGGPWSELTATSPGAGTFVIADIGNDDVDVPSGYDGNGFFKALASGPQDWSAYTSFEVTLSGATLPANQTLALYLLLADASFSTTTSSTEFSLPAFNDGSTATIALDPGALDLTNVAYWGFVVKDPTPLTGFTEFGFEFDSLTVSVIPEPSTYAALLAAVMLGCACIRRRVTRRGAHSAR